MSGAFPANREQWRVASLVCLGSVLGLVRYPLAILAGGPLARVIRTYAHASQESAWNERAAGDGGDSVGVLQWNDGNDLVSPDARGSAFWSGWYQPGEVQKAMLHDWRWWGLALPVVGFGLERYLWTHGASSTSARAAWKGDGIGITWWSQARAEPRAWRAWFAAQSAVLSVVGAVVYAVRRRGRR